MKRYFLIIIIILTAAAGGYWFYARKYAPAPAPVPASNMEITSSAFLAGESIPAQYTCDGANINPPLDFSLVPSEAKSLVLVVDDPDAPAGIWVHWAVWDIDPAMSAVAENSVPAGAREGETSFGAPGYGGPCPPGGTHRYFFKLYALDAVLGLPAGAIYSDLEKAMQSHIVARAELIGLYGR